MDPEKTATQPSPDDYGYALAVWAREVIERQRPVYEKRAFIVSAPVPVHVSWGIGEMLPAWRLDAHIESETGTVWLDHEGRRLRLERVMRVLVVSPTFDIWLFLPDYAQDFPTCDNDIARKKFTRTFTPVLRALFDS